MIYKEGFFYKDFRFGWHKKKLFRLPTKRKDRNYPLKEVPKIKVGNKEGFRLVRDRKSIAQVRALTEVVNYDDNTYKCQECA